MIHIFPNCLINKWEYTCIFLTNIIWTLEWEYAYSSLSIPCWPCKNTYILTKLRLQEQFFAAPIETPLEYAPSNQQHETAASSKVFTPIEGLFHFGGAENMAEDLNGKEGGKLIRVYLLCFEVILAGWTDQMLHLILWPLIHACHGIFSIDKAITMTLSKQLYLRTSIVWSLKKLIVADNVLIKS